MNVRGFATSYMGSMYEVKWGRERERRMKKIGMWCVCVFVPLAMPRLQAKACQLKTTMGQ
jgi:hypothetical protein